MKSRSKIAVVGSGLVGAATAYALAVKGVVSEIILIDANHDKALGEAIDISHGLSFIGEMQVRAGDYSDVANCDVIIVAAGANRKPDETRIDLAAKNVSIARDVTAQIMKYYNTGVILVVANPVDIITYTIQKESGLPIGRVFGSGTVLDSVRFRYILSEKFNVDVRNMHGFIAGEHGDSQFPVWSMVRLAGMNLESACEEFGVTVNKEEIEKEVRTAGAQVIKNKGATYYAIASVLVRICEAIIKNQRSIHHTSVLLTGQYGLDDVSLSVPCVIGSGGVERIIETEFLPEEIEKLHNSAAQLKNIINQI